MSQPTNNSATSIGNVQQSQIPQLVNLQYDEKTWAEGGVIGLYSQGRLFKIYRDFLKEHAPSFVTKHRLMDEPPPRPTSPSITSIALGNDGRDSKKSKKKSRQRKYQESISSVDVSRNTSGEKGGTNDLPGMTGRSWVDAGLAGDVKDPAQIPTDAQANTSSTTLDDVIDGAQSVVPLERDGMPIYLVLDEDPEYLENFLWALVKPSTFSNDKKVTYDVLFSVLLLSTKYDVPKLRQTAIGHILSTYPPTLNRFLNREETRTLPSQPGALFALLALDASYRREASGNPQDYHQKYPHLIPPVLLPVLFYCCTTHSVEELVNGVDYRDKKVRLSSQDLRRCLIAGPKLLAITDDVYDFLKEDYVEGCQWVRRRPNNRAPRNISYYQENPCALGRLRAICVRPVNDPDVFDDDDIWWEAFEKNVCEVCKERAEEAYVIARSDAWKTLPRVLQMEYDWETLIRISDTEAHEEETLTEDNN